MKLVMFDGNEVTVTKAYAKKAAEFIGLLEIPTLSGPVYVNPKNVSSIVAGGDASEIQKLLEIEKTGPAAS